MNFDNPDNPAPELPPADLLAAAGDLDRAAAGIEQPLPGATAGVPAVIDWQKEAGDLADFAAGLFVPLYPRLAGVWTPERKGQLVVRLAAVLQKYNLNMAELFGKWGPEIMLALVVVPSIPPTWQAIKADNADAKRAAIEAHRAAPPAGQPAAPAPAAAANAPGATPPPPPDADALHSLA